MAKISRILENYKVLPAQGRLTVTSFLFSFLLYNKVPLLLKKIVDFSKKFWSDNFLQFFAFFFE